MKISPLFQVIFVATALLSTPSRLPAPVSEESPTPGAEQHAKTKLKEKSTAQTGNQGFDGIWIGTETDTDSLGPKDFPNSVSGTVVIVISEGGKIVGKFRGPGPGRYESVTRRGNTLSLAAGNTKLELTLSADGHTLSESGMFESHTGGGRGGSWIWRVKFSGVFHRGTVEDIEKHKNDPYPALTSKNRKAR